MQQLADSVDLAPLRQAVRARAIAPERDVAEMLFTAGDPGPAIRAAAREEAADFVRQARASAGRSSLIDKFLQEYGLSTSEGVTLMRLAEALLRTPDVATADALIRDKIESGDWRAHIGRSPFPLVNFSTRALTLTAAWLDDIEARDPARRLLKSTKSLLDRLGDPTIRAAVAQAMRIMGEHFVLGQTIEEALKRGRAFAAEGYTFSFDMLGEAALTAEDAEKFYSDYAHAIAAIGDAANGSDVRSNPGISIKLSALHPRYEYAQRQRALEELLPRVRSLAVAAKARGLGFNIDAEEAERLDLSLDLFEGLLADDKLAGWDGFGVVVQAYQRRALDVIAWLAALARARGRKIMVRLVKGAYWDAEIKRAQVLGLDDYPVFTRKALTDASYAACAKALIRNADVIYPQFATHNALSAAIVKGLAGDADYEVQRLHGMGEALHDRLLKSGLRSRIYAPVGGHRELLPYLVRRLLENGANSSFVNQLFDPDLSVDDIVSDPFERPLSQVFERTPLGAPRDLFAGARQSARGWDVSDPGTAEALQGAAVAAFDFEGPLRAATPVDMPTGDHRLVRISNPADRNDVSAEAAVCDAETADLAVRRARSAARAWSARAPADRRAILEAAAAHLEKNAPDFIRLCVREAGKTIPDAIAEVREAVDFLHYYALKGEALSGQPLGVVACISPWNFPLAIYLGQVAGALAAGNAVVAKPAEQTPVIALMATRLLHQAGVPEDALHCLPGDGAVVGAALTQHPDVAGVVFTGSTATAQAINRSLADAGKHDAVLIAETGGVNAMIVDSTALLEQAVKDTIASAFQSAGQRCSAARLVCVQADVADRYMHMLSGAMRELVIGDPARLRTDVGPVIDDEAAAAISNRIAHLRSHARLIAESSTAPEKPEFIRPIAFEIQSVSDAGEEVFGPVLHIVRFESNQLDAIIDDINRLDFGLTMGVHTRIDETMNRIVARARVGNLYINRNQIGAVVGVQPFGGEGLSGTGPKAGGPHYLDAMRRQAEAAPTPGALIISDGAPPALTNQLLARATAAGRIWREAQDKPDMLRAAARSADPETRSLLLESAHLADQIADPIELPGPTGESNTLRIRGRGVVLCVGPGETSLRAQVARALAAGNAVLCAAGIADRLAGAFAAAGGPTDVAVALTSADRPPEALLTHPEVTAIAADVDPATRGVLKRLLAARDGPVTPLLSADDPLHRYGVERTVTINTTAAGGDVRLLALPQA